MPINEILAPVYVVGKIATPVYPSGHGFRLYFASGCSWAPGATGDEDNWHLMEGSTDHGGIAGIVHELLTRYSGALPAGSSISELDLWHSVPAAPNVLDHINTLPTGNSFGIGSGTAAGYNIVVFGGALRNYFRLSFFDGGDGKPQKYPPTVPPSGDDGSGIWYVTKGAIPFATNDGIRLIRHVSSNVGYNRKLARSYGRAISP